LGRTQAQPDTSPDTSLDDLCVDVLQDDELVDSGHDDFWPIGHEEDSVLGHVDLGMGLDLPCRSHKAGLAGVARHETGQILSDLPLKPCEPVGTGHADDGLVFKPDALGHFPSDATRLYGCRMAGPLVLGMVLVAGALFGDQQVSRFQRLAAVDVASRLEGADKKVAVQVELNGLAGVWGDLLSARITASDFTIQGLPLFTEPERSTAGKVGTLRLRLSDFTLRKLRVAKLDADIPGCRYDFGLARDKHQLRLSRSGVGVGTVRVREDDLARFIMAKYPEITNCTVKADKGVVWVEGHGRFLLITTDFTCIASLGVVDKTKIVLKDAKVYFDWNRVDGIGRDAVLKLLTPVVDLDRDLGLLDAVDVKTVDCRAGFLVATGATKIPLKPKS